MNKLENTETNLEESTDQYSKMMQLNQHIQDQFKKKAKEIRQSVLKKHKKKSR